MRNFNKIALATALTITSGSGIVHAAELGEQQTAVNTEYLMPYSATLGSIAIGSSLVTIELTENNNLSQIDASEIFDEIQPLNATEKAVRIGNPVQLREPPPPPPPIEPIIIPNFNNWVRLAECESGGNWQINTGNGYYGGVQFNLSSWRAAGGLLFATRPDLASMEEQMLIAENLLAMQGWRSGWPGCSRKLGLG